MHKERISELNKYYPLISVVVPIYNVELYLKQCIESIIHQTYKNLEIILIDDGSTDKSKKICDQYVNIDKRIQVYHKKNSGLGLTRNYGMERATGKYIIFVDSDDYLDATAIKKLVDSTKNGEYDTIIGGFRRVNNKNKIISSVIYPNREFYDKEIQYELLPHMLGNSPHNHDSIKMSVWNNLFDMDIIRQQKLKFCSERKYISEDLVWDCTYFQYAHKVKLIDSSQYFYRYNPHSLSNSYKKNKFQLSVNLYQYILSLIKEIGLEEEAIHRLQKQFFINTRASIEQEKNNNSKAGIQNISKICKNKTLKSAISDYPIVELGLSQRIFIGLIKGNHSFILYWLIKLESIKN